MVFPLTVDESLLIRVWLFFPIITVSKQHRMGEVHDIVSRTLVRAFVRPKHRTIRIHYLPPQEPLCVQNMGPFHESFQDMEPFHESSYPSRPKWDHSTTAHSTRSAKRLIVVYVMLVVVWDYSTGATPRAAELFDWIH